MTCSEFEQVAIEISRGTVTDAVAMAHAETCARCRQRLENEKALNAALRTLEIADEALGASPEVERALVAQFRKRHPAVSRRWRKPAAIGAIAAGLVLAMALGLRRNEPPVSPPVKTEPQAVAVPAAPQVIAPVYRERQKTRPRRQRMARQKPARQPATLTATRNREIMTDFIPVVYDPTPIERGHLVRVRLPRSAIAAFGLPVNEQHADEPIKADVLVGDDGLARAVRFVK
jgi:hypothetical protein